MTFGEQSTGTLATVTSNDDHSSVASDELKIRLVNGLKHRRNTGSLFNGHGQRPGATKPNNSGFRVQVRESLYVFYRNWSSPLRKPGGCRARQLGHAGWHGRPEHVPSLSSISAERNADKRQHFPAARSISATERSAGILHCLGSVCSSALLKINFPKGGRVPFSSLAVAQQTDPC